MTLAAAQETAAVARSSGVLSILNVQPGQVVHRGDVLAAIETHGHAPTRVLAPMDGEVADVPVTLGQSVEADRTRIATLIDVSAIRATAEVPESAAALIRPGGRVTFTVPSYPSLLSAGTVARVRDDTHGTTHRRVRLHGAECEPHAASGKDWTGSCRDGTAFGAGGAARGRGARSWACIVLRSARRTRAHSAGAHGDRAGKLHRSGGRLAGDGLHAEPRSGAARRGHGWNTAGPLSLGAVTPQVITALSRVGNQETPAASPSPLKKRTSAGARPRALAVGKSMACGRCPSSDRRQWFGVRVSSFKSTVLFVIAHDLSGPYCARVSKVQRASNNRKKIGRLGRRRRRRVDPRMRTQVTMFFAPAKARGAHSAASRRANRAAGTTAVAKKAAKAAKVAQAKAQTAQAKAQAKVTAVSQAALNSDATPATTSANASTAPTSSNGTSS